MRRGTPTGGGRPTTPKSVSFVLGTGNEPAPMPMTKHPDPWRDRALGVYVHFPWCLAKCPYCDFVSYATPRGAIDHERYADAVISELNIRLTVLKAMHPELPPLTSVFFGGGTPSLWAPVALGRVLSAVVGGFGKHAEAVEITVECNPSSLDEDGARALAGVGVNRLSIGVQGLDDARLRFLGRLHTGEQALSAVRGALRVGGLRVSADLIYAVSGQRPDEGAREAATLADLGLTHVSAYSLTIEPGTRFGELARRGRLPLAEDGAMVEAFFAIDETLRARGFEHYEISNYAREGHEARHNLGYWRGDDYLGLGCAAYGTLSRAPRGQGAVRYRNEPDPARYVEAALGANETSLESVGGLVSTIEPLPANTLMSERIMLGLRLRDGFDLAEAAVATGAEAWTQDRAREVSRLSERGRLVRQGDRLSIPRAAWIWADDTAASLF
jgi:putative oxygen-independent coproporphyrinogen III oxidase